MAPAEVAARASRMFVVGANAPMASDMPPAACTATKGLVKLAFDAANDLCKAHGTALSEYFGNFDRVVALGWLLGDLLGMPLAPRAMAYTVGLKARRAAGTLETDQKEERRKASRAASKLPAGDARREEAKAVGEAAAARHRGGVGFTSREALLPF